MIIPVKGISGFNSPRQTKTAAPDCFFLAPLYASARKPWHGSFRRSEINGSDFKISGSDFKKQATNFFFAPRGPRRGACGDGKALEIQMLKPEWAKLYKIGRFWLCRLNPNLYLSPRMPFQE